MLRPFVKDLHTSLTSRKLAATDPSRGSTWRASTQYDKKGLVGGGGTGSILSRSDEESQKMMAFELAGIPEEPSQALKLGYHADAYYSPSEVDLRIKESHTKPMPLHNNINNNNNNRRDDSGSWPL